MYLKHPPTIMPDIKTTTDKWIALKAFINTCLKVDDECFTETLQVIQQNKETKKEMLNDRGMSKGEEIKKCLSLPPKLGQHIFKQFPNILETKSDLYRFMREYPQFCAATEPFKTKYT